jgi:hypothetical protein
VVRNDAGQYTIERGWGGAKNIVFENNEYFGHTVDLPPDSRAIIDPHPREPNTDWNEPLFNPADPKAFSAYMARHRDWMLHMFMRQFGTAPEV